KGYEFRKGEYVIIEPEELKRIEPKTAKAMEILEFVKAEEIDPIYFESSYYLMPEEAGKRPYALLQKALEDSKHVAVAKLAMHNRSEERRVGKECRYRWLMYAREKKGEEELAVNKIDSGTNRDRNVFATSLRDV